MSDKTRVYVVEDKAITREMMLVALEAMGFEIAGSNDEAMPALLEMQETPVDIAILDIDLIGDHDGVWLAHQLNETLQIPFVFLTAFGDEATFQRVIATKPHGFLLKPFNKTTIHSAILIALENFTQKQVAQTAPGAALNKEEVAPSAVVKDSLFVKHKGMLVRVRIDSLNHIMSDGKYLELHTNDKMYLVRQKISTLLDLLPAASFMQVHQRYIINLTRVAAVGPSYAMVNATEIPVSRGYRDDLNQRLITL